MVAGVQTKQQHDGTSNSGTTAKKSAGTQQVHRNAVNGQKKQRPVDTWDEPELDEPEVLSKRVIQQVASEDSSNSSKKLKAATKPEPDSTQKPALSKAEGKSTEESTVDPEASEKSDDGCVSPLTAAGATKKKRSFCNFHYMTTQGGSSNVEPGDDPSMQSPGTSTKALTLLEFAGKGDANEKLHMPPMG